MPLTVGSVPPQPGASPQRGDRLPSRSELALTLLAGPLLGSLFVAALEVAVVLLRGEAAPTDLSEILVLLGSTAAILALPAASLGLGAGLLLLLFPRLAPPSRVVAGVARWFMGADADDGRLGAARLLAMALTLLVALVLGVYGVYLVVGDETAGRQASILVALGLAAALPALWYIHEAFLGLLVRVLGATRRPGASSRARRSAVDVAPPAGAVVPTAVALTTSLMAVGALVALVGLLRRHWDVVLALDLRPAALVITWLAAAALASRSLLRSPKRLRWVGSRTLLVGGLLLGTGGHQALHRLEVHPEAKVALLRETVLANRVAKQYRRLLDADGDGHATVLGEADCDDTNPAVHPGARDVPGNGLDEDCWGGDQPLPEEPQEDPDLLEPIVLRPHLPPAPNASGRWNLVLITMDTVRWDHTTLAGYERETTPNLQRLAERSVMFERAWSQAPQTKSSMPSLLTGRFTSEVYRSRDLWMVMYDDNVTFPELLSEAGYRTAAVLSHNFFLPRYGLSQGFEHWDLGFLRRQSKTHLAIPAAEEVTDRAIAYLQDNERDLRPFMLWIHYIDPHHPYIDHRLDVDFGKTEMDRYDEEIRYTDQQLGRFLDWLQTSPLGSSTVVVVHSDHGEGFREHGYMYHGMSLYEDQLRVPLVLHVPGTEPRVVEQSACNIDIAPTLLEAARLHPRTELQGRSLIPLALGEPELQERPVFAELVADERHTPRKVMIVWPWKLEHAVAQDYFRLYHLERDPLERKDLSRKEPVVARRMISRMRSWMAGTLHEVPAGVLPTGEPTDAVAGR